MNNTSHPDSTDSNNKECMVHINLISGLKTMQFKEMDHALATLPIKEIL